MASKRSKLVVIVSEKETWSGFGRLVRRQGAPGRHVWQLIPTQERLALPLNLTLWHRNWLGQAISPSLVRQCARIPHCQWVLTLLQSYRPKIRRGVWILTKLSGPPLRIWMLYTRKMIGGVSPKNTFLLTTYANILPAPAQGNGALRLPPRAPVTSESLRTALQSGGSRQVNKRILVKIHPQGKEDPTSGHKKIQT